MRTSIPSIKGGASPKFALRQPIILISDFLLFRFRFFFGGGDPFQDLHRRQEATSGNRDMYQEVDLIDIALGSARKQCDDAKERANRLSVTVDRLRDALSRFMSKVRPGGGRPASNEKQNHGHLLCNFNDISPAVCMTTIAHCLLWSSGCASCWGVVLALVLVVCR